MKKRVIAIVSSILLIIALFGGIQVYIRSKNNNGFPHYKQALIPLQGKIYSFSQNDINLPLVFVDEIEMSEMASSENIKSIKLTTEDNKEITSKTWSVTQRNNTSKCVERDLDVVLSANNFTNSDTYIKTVAIEFNDGLVKTYDVGKVSVIVYKDDDMENKFGTLDVLHNYISTLNEEMLPISGDVMSIRTFGENIRIDSVDYGIDGMGLDSSNLKVIDKDIDINDFEKAKSNQEDIAKAFVSSKTVETLEKFKSFEIKAKISSNSDLPDNSSTTVLAPFEYTDDYKAQNVVTIYTAKIIYTDLDTGEKKFVIDQTPNIRIPVYGSELSAETYLEENGK